MLRVKEGKVKTKEAVKRDVDWAVWLREATLYPSIRALTVTIPKQSWVVLDGPDALGIALFCDLCFGYLEPDSGSVDARVHQKDLGFLGRSSTTYGPTLLSHLTCGTRNLSRHDLTEIANSCLGAGIHRQLPAGTLWPLCLEIPISSLLLEERDLLEISEANLLMQDRQAVVIDTTSHFHQVATAQGFRHSRRLLNGQHTIFWIVDSSLPYPMDAQPWLSAARTRAIEPINLYFSLEPRGAGIN